MRVSEQQTRRNTLFTEGEMCSEEVEALIESSLLFKSEDESDGR